MAPPATPKASMSSLLDREIHAIEADAFGHRHFAKALESLIESPVHTPPFSIGLLGKWGTGKSTIKSLYLSSLRDDDRKNEDKRTRRERFHCITFNAWRFGGENIKRALLRHVFLELQGDESLLQDKLFRQIQRTSVEPKPWQDFIREISDRWLWASLQILGFFILIYLALLLIQTVFDFQGQLVKLGVVAVITASATERPR